MSKTGSKTTPVILLALLGIYFVALFKITLFQNGSPGRSLNFTPLFTIADYSRSILNGNRIIGLSNLLGNLMLFFPLGYIVASLFPPMRKLAKISALAFIFSLLIEVGQYVLACGATDIDDVILNVLGGITGYGVYVGWAKFSASKKWAILISGLMIALTCTGFYARNNLNFLLPHSIFETYHEIGGEWAGNRLHSTHAFLIQLNEGGERVLLDQGGSERIYPASLTKIMTAVVALENIEDLDAKITLRENMFSVIYLANASVAGFLAGETVSALDLLYGLMLPSGAECAMGLAEYVSGTESAFVDLMNEKARQLGMYETHFANSTGLHDPDHYASLKDLAGLLEYALGDDTFYKIFTAARYSTKPTNLHPQGITLYSTLFSNLKSANFPGGVILGGKTGYTTEAGQCLASLAEKNGQQFIAVTCGAPGDNQKQFLHLEDVWKIFNMIELE